MRCTTIILALVLLALPATAPLAAQRSVDARIAAAPLALQPAGVATSAAAADGDAMQPWVRHALIGGAIGAVGGWALSGLPCEGAPSSCPSAATSVVAGAVIGAIVGALWSWGRGY